VDEKLWREYEEGKLFGGCLVEGGEGKWLYIYINFFFWVIIFFWLFVTFLFQLEIIF